MLDIDHFKLVNDTYGHQTGDQVLKDVTRTCLSALRTTDIMGRYGGEEFLIVLPETDKGSSMFTAERIRKVIENKFKDSDLKVTISIGCTLYKNEDTKMKELIYRADQALYQSKKTGRNKVSFN